MNRTPCEVLRRPCRKSCDAPGRRCPAHHEDVVATGRPVKAARSECTTSDRNGEKPFFAAKPEDRRPIVHRCPSQYGAFSGCGGNEREIGGGPALVNCRFLVPRTRSSHHNCRESDCELRVQSGTRIIE